MKYFTRCRILRNIFTGVLIVLGIILAFDFDTLTDNIQVFNIDLHFCIYMLALAVFLFLIITIIALSVIIKDAQADLGAVMNYSSEKK